jgi:peptidoglycan/xylan/chitin deacetylase (PgdA/CDA1 family)
MTARDVPVEPRMRLGEASPGRLTVALTLDASPGAFDERIATALVEGGIKATIFVTGLWLRENPVGLALLLAHRDLFAIENHGELHIPPALGHRRIYAIPAAGDLAAVRREVTEGAASIHAATPRGAVNFTWSGCSTIQAARPGASITRPRAVSPRLGVVTIRSAVICPKVLETCASAAPTSPTRNSCCN